MNNTNVDFPVATKENILSLLQKFFSQKIKNKYASNQDLEEVKKLAYAGL